MPLGIECWFGTANYWSSFENGSAYACIVYNIRGAENVRETITDVTGPLSEGTSFADVKIIDIRGFCNFMPAGFDKYFENIEGFSSYNTSMKTISSDDLKQFPKLRELWIYFNLLEVLPSNLFEHNPNIESIHFKVNKIKYIGPEFFTYIPKLSVVNFATNECIDRNVDSDKSLVLLKREIKKKCSNKNGPIDVPTEVFTMQLNQLRLEASKLEKKIKEQREIYKKCRKDKR